MARSRSLCFIALVVLGLAGCAQPERAILPVTKKSATGGRFSGAGKVSMHPGQPCTSQIMFDFRLTGERSTVQLSASMPESKILTDAANRGRRVQIWGRWRHRPDGCSYIEVSKVAPLSIAVVF